MLQKLKICYTVEIFTVISVVIFKSDTPII